jgi:hypothetical protein
MDRLKCRGMYGIEVVDVKCVGRGRKSRQDKKRGYAYIKLPGPTRKFSWGVKVPQPEDYSWLNSFLVGSHSRVGDINEWKVACAANLRHCLQKAEKIVESHGRSVWFFACPLERKICFRGSSCSGTVFLHWAILVSQLTRAQMIARMEGNSSDRDLVCGELHELRECQGTAIYTSRSFSAAIHRRRGTVLKYLGQTDLSNDDLDEYGTHLFFGDVSLTYNCRPQLRGGEPPLPFSEE